MTYCIAWGTIFNSSSELLCYTPEMYINNTSVKKKKNYQNINKKAETALFQQRFVKAMVFPVILYRCKSWAIKKAENQRIDALSCGTGEDSWEFLGLQGDQTSQS